MHDQVSPAADTPPHPGKKELSKGGVLTRTVLGYGFESYDFTAFAIFAPFFATQFFHPDDQVAATLSALLVFALGFIARPIGALFFGWFADQRGRRAAMVLALFLSAGGSLMIGLMPTYGAVGLISAVLLTVARLMQGFGHGGESGGAYSYLAEVAPSNRRGLWGATVQMSAISGIFVATLMGAAMTSILGTEALQNWAWRIPFIIGGLLGFFGLYLRTNLHESEAFEAQKAVAAKARTHATTVPVRDGYLVRMWQHRKNIMRVIGLSVGLTVFNYSYAVSGTARAITVEKADPEVALWAGLAAQALYMILLPIWGLLSDRWGRRPSFLITGLGLAVVAFPLANLMGPTFWQIFLPIFIALFFLGAAIAADPAYFAELFPTNVRATGVGFPYAFAISLFGGTAPLIATWLGVNDLGWVFTTYCMALALTTALVAWFSPETNGRNLRD